MSSLGFSPDQASSQAWKNFAQSQSPPSVSPIRRALMGDSASSGEEGEAPSKRLKPDPLARALLAEDEDAEDAEAEEEEAAPEAVAPMDDGEEDDDEEEEEDQQMQHTAGSPNAFSAPGVQVLRSSVGGAAESSAESDAEDVPPVAEATGLAASAPSADASRDVRRKSSGDGMLHVLQTPAATAATQDEEEDEEEAEEEEVVQDEEEAEVSEGLQESPDVDEQADDLPEPNGAALAEDPAAARSEAAQMAAAVGVAHQIVAAESWGGSLPPEVSSGTWTMAADVCSLQISGNNMKLPRSVYDRLYAYQRQGVAWMWNLYHQRFGGILADEMGLGKTVQTAAFLACLKFTNQGSRFLVVVPVTLLEQWRRELATWTANTGLAVHVMHGTAQERKAALRGMVSKGGVLLISYDLVRTCAHQIRTAGLASLAAAPSKTRKRKNKRGCRDDDSPSEAEEAAPAQAPAVPEEEDESRPWDVVIVDEGHQIKNPSCQSGRALRRLEARSRFLLTGTPLQNKLGDLWALMDFAQPALLGNHATFEQNFSQQIANGSKRNATRFAVELKDHLARELKRLTAPHFLRRLKDEVAPSVGGAREAADGMSQADTQLKELPSKMDVVLWLNLTTAQTELYNLCLNSDLVRRATGGGKGGMDALRAIGLLKKLCNHPLLCLPQDEFNQWRSQTLTTGGATAASSSSSAPPPMAPPPMAVDDPTQDDLGLTQPAPECTELLPRLQALLPSSAQGAALLSCKLRVLSVLLPQLQKRGHRCLIFSSSTRMLDLIQACVLRVLGLRFLRIDGTIEAKDRDVKLQKFQQKDSKYFAMCLSVQVGGTGLTITGADRVILVDPAWNPSTDAQAIDRVHRIGQEREVVVYRLIGAGSIEDKMFRLQVFKRGLSKTFTEHEQQVRFFTNGQLKTLFEPPDQSTSTQSLMAEQIGTEALEHEDLLKVVAGDIGDTDDPEALAFWQSSDVLGFSDYQRLFMFLEHADKEEEQAGEQAKAMTEKLKGEQYHKDQVVEGKVRMRDFSAKENLPPQECPSDVQALTNA